MSCCRRDPALLAINSAQHSDVCRPSYRCSSSASVTDWVGCKRLLSARPLDMRNRPCDQLHICDCWISSMWDMSYRGGLSSSRKGMSRDNSRCRSSSWSIEQHLHPHYSRYPHLRRLVSVNGFRRRTLPFLRRSSIELISRPESRYTSSTPYPLWLHLLVTSSVWRSFSFISSYLSVVFVSAVASFNS